jgi:L-fuconolactonase
VADAIKTMALVEACYRSSEAGVNTEASMMPNIDAHQHFWRYDRLSDGWIDDSMSRLRRDFLPDELKVRWTVRASTCIAVQARQSRRNPLAARVGRCESVHCRSHRMDRSPGRRSARPAGTIRGALEVGGCPAHRAGGGRRSLSEEAAFRRAFRCSKIWTVYDILIYPRHLPVAAEFVAGFTRQRFVLITSRSDHIRDGDLARLGTRRALAEFPQVFCKVGLVTEAEWNQWTPEQLWPCSDVVFDAFGANRLIAGSDWPVCTVAGDYRGRCR